MEAKKTQSFWCTCSVLQHAYPTSSGAGRDNRGHSGTWGHKQRGDSACATAVPSRQSWQAVHVTVDRSSPLADIKKAWHLLAFSHAGTVGRRFLLTCLTGLRQGPENTNAFSAHVRVQKQNRRWLCRSSRRRSPRMASFSSRCRTA